MRYASAPGGLRGFSLGYDKALARASTRPYRDREQLHALPEDRRNTTGRRPGPAGEAGGRRAAAAGRADRDRACRRTARRRDERRRGSCPELRVGTAKARVARSDKAAGLALLETEASRAAPPLPARADPLAPDAAVVALLYGGGTTLSVVPGEAGTGGAVIAPLQPGASGAPVFDRAGALAAVVGAMPTAPRLVAGIVPPARYPLVPMSEIRGFLCAAGAALAPAAGTGERTAGEIAAAAGPAVEAIDCAR